MTPLKLMFVPMVALVFGAGLIVGKITAQAPVVAKESAPTTKPTTRPERSPSWLHDQLRLTAEQRTQMDTIWNEVRQASGKSWDKRRELEKERDQALLSLLTPEQKAQHEAILEANRVKRAELDKDRDALVASANEKSKALLNDEQKKKWDELKKDMRGDGRGGPRGPRGGYRGGSDRDRNGDRPSTRPASDASKSI
jgi:Spy/CpxP family protein refolding chaperone